MEKGRDAAGEPGRVAVVSTGAKAKTAAILEKRESWHKQEMCWSSLER